MRFGVVVFPGTWSDCDFHYVISRSARAAGQVRVAPGPRSARISTAWCSPAASRTATTCGRAPSRAARRSWRRCPSSSPAAVSCSARATASRSCARRACCRARSCATSASSTAASPRTCSWRTPRRPFTRALRPGQVLTMPISHGEGKYHADPETLAHAARSSDQVVFRYATAEGKVTRAANPNGSLENIAGIVNEDGNRARADAASRARRGVRPGRYRRAVHLPARSSAASSRTARFLKR